MHQESKPASEWIPELVAKGVISEDEAQPLLAQMTAPPRIEWLEYLGAYSLAQMVISHCPWCGKALPNPHAIERGPKGDLKVLIDQNGEAQVFIDGKPVDASVSQILAANDPPPKR